MALNTQLATEDEDRLAALWEQPGDAGAEDDESTDDGVAALFTSPDGTAPHTLRRQHASSARRSAARTHSVPTRGSCARERPARSRATKRLMAIGVVLFAALMLLTVALSAMTGPTDIAATSPRPGAGHPPATSPRAAPSRDELERRRAAAARARAQRRREHRQVIARADGRRARAARRARAELVRARQRSRSPRRFAGAPPAPQTADPDQSSAPPAAVSSACEEFPPC